MLDPPCHGVLYALSVPGTLLGFQLKPAQQLSGYRVSVFDSPEALLDLGCKLHSVVSIAPVVRPRPNARPAGLQSD